MPKSILGAIASLTLLIGGAGPRALFQMLSNTRAQSSIMVSQPGVICTTTSS